jgi:hypothetical protein
MSEVIKTPLTEDDVKELNKLLEPNESLRFMFVNNSTPHPNGNEHVNCKNGHWNFISNSMGFEPNAIYKIKCSECDEIIFEFKPFAVRIRELKLLEIVK